MRRLTGFALSLFCLLAGWLSFSGQTIRTMGAAGPGVAGTYSSLSSIKAASKQAGREHGEWQMTAALEQMKAQAFLQAGLTGKGVSIGIIDAGFFNANADSSLSRFFAGAGQPPIVKDYVSGNEQTIYTSHSDIDWHGAMVWNLIGGQGPGGLRHGLATDARYYLARTDDGAREYHGEQEFFKQALAWMRSKGVRLVNTSLGYAYGFDNPAENYIPSNMDGKTATVSKAAEEAVTKNNMIVVVAAGNDGDNDWKIVSAPADARDVITVGATDTAKAKKEFSSEGPDFLAYLKPDVSCMNITGGTSFSAPVITGIIACMLQKDPTLTNSRIREILKKSGHLYPYGNNFEGYGVPDATRILQLMDNPTYDPHTASLRTVKKNEVAVTISPDENPYILFHKKDKWIVLKQERPLPATGTITIRRPLPCKRSRMVVDDKLTSKYHTLDTSEPVTRTTLVTSKRVVEILWP